MRKKSLITMVATLGLVAVIGVGATLAYLSSATAPLTNTFTVGKVQIKLDEVDITKSDGSRTESGNHYENMYPGQMVVKDPTTTIEENSSNCYVYMKVAGVDALMDQNFTVEAFDNSIWKKVSGKAEGKDGIYQYVGPKTTEDGNIVVRNAEKTVLEPIFNKVTYNQGAEGTVSELPEIKVSSCAIQAEGLEEAAALTEATEQFKLAEETTDNE